MRWIVNARGADLSSTIPKPDCAWSLADLHSVPPNGIRVMSTFSCGGGSSMGYKLAGCDVIAANDIDPAMAWHYQKNLVTKHYFLCPIRDLLTMDLPSELHSLDILDGSPPCSTFSMAGDREKTWGKDMHFREGQAAQVLSDLFFDYLDLVARLRPRAAIAENVKGMILGNARGYVKLVTRRFREIGYRPQLFLVNAADCGVPQRRERVFFCAVRDDIDVPPLTLAPKHRWISSIEACRDIQSLTPDEIEHTRLDSWLDRMLHSITRPGDSYSKAFERALGKVSRWNHIRLDGLRPACTMAATDQYSHWNERRRLTFREWKRLGGFPDDYEAKSPNVGKYMVGMSVPPRMTQAVATAVVSQWLGPRTA